MSKNPSATTKMTTPASKTTAPVAKPTTPALGAVCATSVCVPEDKIAMRAYEKWVSRGCKHGNDQQDWQEAEAELKAELARQATAGKR